MLQDVILTKTGRVKVNFGSKGYAEYGRFWLRDNCPSSFHSEAQERIFDLLSIPDDLAIEFVTIDASGGLQIRWSHSGHVSHFDADWLWKHRPGVQRLDPAEIQPHIWHSTDLQDGPLRYGAMAVLQDVHTLQSWMQDTKKYGLTLITDIVGNGESSVKIGRRIGFLRESNFGITFEVLNKQNPNNLAYTARELPLHTDLPNQELVPGFQFLHCIANEAMGGNSIFADGFAVAEALKTQNPKAFKLLSEVAIPFRFHDREVDIRMRRPVITIDKEEVVRQITYNAHMTDLIDLPSNIVDAWYDAYRAYMHLTRDPLFKITFKMLPGQMAVFDNRRILHGREAFDPSTGFRHLHGFYVDQGEFDSRLRMLATKTS